MFSAARDPLRAQRVVEGARVPHDLLDRLAVATAAQRIVGLVVERNVEHRAEVEIESEDAKQPSGDVAMLPNEREVALVAQVVRIRRFVADQLQPRDASTLLVDRDDRLDLADRAQVVDEPAQLRRALDISPEEDESTRLNSPKQIGGFMIEFGSGYAG